MKFINDNSNFLRQLKLTYSYKHFLNVRYFLLQNDKNAKDKDMINTQHSYDAFQNVTHEAISHCRAWYLDPIDDNVLRCLQCIIVRSPYTSGNSSSTRTHIPVLECTLFRARTCIFGARAHSSRLAYSVLINLKKKGLKSGSWTIDGTFYIEYSCIYRVCSEIDITTRKRTIYLA